MPGLLDKGHPIGNHPLVIASKIVGFKEEHDPSAGLATDHGLLFGSDGKVVEIPGQELIPRSARVKRYAVVDRHSWIWVWMGDADAADPALIPPAVGYDDPGYILGHGQLDYEAEARLINDNLLDFSHLSYVHAKSFGAGPEFAQNTPTVTPLMIRNELAT